MIKLFAPSQIMSNDENLTVCRDLKTIYKQGKPLPPKQLKFCIDCNIQPLNGRELELVPEADRYKEQYWIYMQNCEYPLEINDRIIRKGLDDNNCEIDVNFQVQQIAPWGSGPGSGTPYTKARIVRIDIGRNATP